MIPQGLTAKEVQSRITQGLVNKSPKSETKTISQILTENIFSLFNFIILGIILFVLFFYFKNGDDRLLLDTLGISLVGFTTTAIALYQEIKSKIALDKVSLLLKKRVTVIRDSEETEIEPDEIVKDDIIKVGTGDQIIVDGPVVYSRYMEIDESLLTGESLPIEKSPGDEVLSGSFCLSGSGYYRAKKIGDESYANTVTKLAKKHKFLLTPLQRKINFILEVTFLSALVIVAAETIIHLNNPGVLEENDFIRRIATILTSLVPQGLVFFASVTYALGVYRISKLGAIIEKLNAIESFSSIQTVCMDKTGTITKNNLQVKYYTNMTGKSDEDILKLLGSFVEKSSDKNSTIRAIKDMESNSELRFADEYPFKSENKYSIVEFKQGSKNFCYVLGGYDVLIEKAEDQKTPQDIFREKELSYYRNLLFGRVTNFSRLSEIKGSGFKFDVEPLMIVSITDTPRADAGEALDLFERNNIDVKILSGDSADSITSVLKDIGRKPSENAIITGKELELAGPDRLSSILKEKSIFARLKPDQKLAIIKSLKNDGKYTAMIGDGVNDLPAIKEAQMGIAMEEGSQITKEVADIVLLKNKFSLLPRIFDEGNTIVNSVNYVSKLFLTKNFIVIYISSLSILFLLDFPLTPRRVALINIFGISLPAYLLMLKNTNTEKNPNFIKDIFTYVAIAGAVIIAAGYAGIFLTNLFYPGAEAHISMIMLSIMIFISITNYLIVAIRNERENWYFYTSAALLFILYVFFTVTDYDFPGYNLIKLFYEIEYIPLKYWTVIISMSLLGSGVLVFIQKFRERIFHLSIK